MIVAAIHTVIWKPGEWYSSQVTKNREELCQQMGLSSQFQILSLCITYFTSPVKVPHSFSVLL